MANKRMININLVDSDKFLEMPPTTQNLYFHLCVRADDDGFVNSPKKIQRMICANDDDLKLLITKGYIIPFESGVIVITHWKVHNTIQKDRYHKTQYENELKRLSYSDNGEYVKKDIGVFNKNIECIQDGYKMETELDKTRLDKTRLDKISTVSKTPYQEIINLYHEICIRLPKTMKVTNNRKKSIKARYEEYGKNIEVFKKLFKKANDSDFLCGVSTDWKANFDWLMNQQNMAKVLEDRYKNKEDKKKGGYPTEYVDYGPITEFDDGNRF